MLYRKLIKFGDSSFVISLPKEWVDKNSLKKGDVIGIDMGAKNELFILPKSKGERELTETTINLDSLPNPESLKTFIISAYMKHYDTINIVGGDLIKSSENIRRYFHDLASIEIVEQGSKKITARCFLDANNLSVPALIRRLDVMTRSMLMDAETSISSENMKEYVYQKEYDVTRLTFLIFKTLRKALVEPELANKLKLDPLAILQAWNVVASLEDIADQAKRLCKHLGKGRVKNRKKLEDIFKRLMEQYGNATKAYHTNDRDLAMKVVQNRNALMAACKEYLEESVDTVTVSIIEKIRRAAVYVSNIAKITIDR